MSQPGVYIPLCEPEFEAEYEYEPDCEPEDGAAQILNMVVDEGVALSEEASKTNLTSSNRAADGELRLDRWLTIQCPDMSRSMLKKIIDDGGVQVNGQVARPSRRLKLGDLIRVVIEEPQPLDAKPQPIPVPIVYEDDHVIVVDKPAGLSVHPGPGHPDGTLVNALLYHCAGTLAGIGGTLRPGIVHRLDLDTSGLMVVAKTDMAHRFLVDSFRERSVKRRYLAIGHRAPQKQGHVELPAEGAFDTLYGRHPTDRKKFTSKVDTGKRAITNYRVLERFAHGYLVEARLETGRTHQVRVHFYEAGFPLFGEQVYTWNNLRQNCSVARNIVDSSSIITATISNDNDINRSKINPQENSVVVEKKRGIERQALHAWHLSFLHPEDHRHMEFKCDPPEDFLHLLERMRKGKEL